jgi:hypothetical protein
MFYFYPGGDYILSFTVLCRGNKKTGGKDVWGVVQMALRTG